MLKLLCIVYFPCGFTRILHWYNNRSDHQAWCNWIPLIWKKRYRPYCNRWDRQLFRCKFGLQLTLAIELKPAALLRSLVQYYICYFILSKFLKKWRFCKIQIRVITRNGNCLKLLNYVRQTLDTLIVVIEYE